MHVRTVLLIALLAFLLFGGGVLAQVDLEIIQWAFTGIGGQPSGDSYSLSSTLGQSEIAEMQGDDYTLRGGAVAGGKATGTTAGGSIYLPLIQR